MRLARVLLLSFVAAILVIIALIAILPRELDWNRYRGSFEVLAGDALGRPVTIAGPIKLSLLPEPVLTASRVEIGGARSARITVAELRLQVALAPLLSGEVDARSLTLRNPVLHLAWPPPEDFVWSVPPWLGTLSAEIDDGTIDVGSFKLTHVSATLSSGRADAALMLAGTAVADGRPWRINVNLGEPGPGGKQDLTASLVGSGALVGTSARFSGQLDTSGRVTGHVMATSRNLSELLSVPPLPVRAEADLSLAGGRAALRDLAVTLGSASARGTGVLTLMPSPRLDLALASTGIVPLDPWLDALRRGGQSRLPIALSLTSPRGLLAHGLVQSVALAVVLDPNGARIGAFRAILPGEARVALDGRIDRVAAKAAKKDSWEFVGTARLAAPRLATTLRWLRTAAPHLLPQLPAGVLKQATFTARVSANGEQVALDDINGTIGESHVHGGARFGFGAHPTVNLGLELDRLDLDPWFEAAPRSPADFSRLLDGGSIQLRLTAQQASLNGSVMSGLSLDAAATPEQLIVRRLDATSEGAHAIASGTIGKDGTVTAGSLALTAANPALLARLLPRPLGPALARWPVAFSLAAHATGPLRKLALKVDATLGDLRLTASPVLDATTGTWAGPVTLRDPDAMKLIATSGLTQHTRWLGPGSFSLIAHATAGVSDLALDDFRLVAGTLIANGNLDVRPGPPFARVTGSVHANVLPIPLLTGNELAPLPFDIFTKWRGSVELTADQALGAGRLLLRDVRGRVSDSATGATILLDAAPPGGGALSLALSLDAGATPPSARLGATFQTIPFTGGLTGSAVDLSTGTIDGDAALTAKGYSLAAMLATLGGSVQLHAVNGSLVGLNLQGVQEALVTPDEALAKKRLATALAGGTSRFTEFSLDAKAAEGRFALGAARLQSKDGEITARGSFDLPARSLDLTLRIKPAIADAPPLTVRLAGSAQTPKRLTETTAVLAWLAARQASTKKTPPGTRLEHGDQGSQ